VTDRGELPTRRTSDAAAFTQADLLGRGWGKAAIVKLLGDPDERIRRRGGGVVTFFHACRVEMVERERQDWRKSEKRASAATASAAAAREGLEAEVRALQITLPDIPQVQLRAHAIRHYNARAQAFSQDPATAGCPDILLRRITTNYVRHELVSYDDMCDALRGRIGRAECYELIRDRVNAAAATKYPDVCASADEVKKWR
jgi:hypothetical protein